MEVFVEAVLSDFEGDMLLIQEENGHDPEMPKGLQSVPCKRYTCGCGVAVGKRIVLAVLRQLRTVLSFSCVNIVGYILVYQNVV